MRILKRRILTNNGVFHRGMSPKSMNLAMAEVSARFAIPFRSSVPRKKQRVLGVRPSVAHEVWQQEQERKQRKIKCRQQ